MVRGLVQFGGKKIPRAARCFLVRVRPRRFALLFSRHRPSRSSRRLQWLSLCCGSGVFAVSLAFLILLLGCAAEAQKNFGRPGGVLAAMDAEETQIEASFCEAIRIAREQKLISLGKRVEATYAEYLRQKA